MASLIACGGAQSGCSVARRREVIEAFNAGTCDPNGVTATDCCTDAPTSGDCGDPIGAWVKCGTYSDEDLSAHLRSAKILSGDEWAVAQWVAEREFNHAGYNVYRAGPHGMSPRRLNAALITEPTFVGTDGTKTYTHFLGDVRLEGFYVEDVDVFGKKSVHGPFSLGRSYGPQSALKGTSLSRIRVPAVKLLSRPLARALAADAPDVSAAPDAGVRPHASDALLWARESGVFRVTHEDLLAAGVDLSGTPSDDLALSDEGRPVSRHVEDPDGRFGPGDFIEFVAQVSPTLYSNQNAYRLGVDPTRVRQPRAVTATGRWRGWARPSSVAHTARFEQQRAYHAGAPGADPWYDAWMLARKDAPYSVERTFDLPGYEGGHVELVVDVWGVSDMPGTGDDHRVEVLVNGEPVGDEVSYEGRGLKELSYTVPGALLADAGNVLELALSGDTGFDVDLQALDGFSVRYHRRTQAHQGYWTGSLGERLPATGPFAWLRDFLGWSRQARVEGFEGLTVGWNTRGERNLFPDGDVVVQGYGRWHVADDSGVQRPVIEAGVPEAAFPARTDYLIITHPLFAAHVGPIVDLQAGRGLSTEVVTTRDIYAEYSDFEPSADAIREFIADSDVRYVLLVGGDSFDYHDNLGLGRGSYVPTHYTETGGGVTYAPSDALLSDREGDDIPDVAIGRLPVRSLDDLTLLIEKLQAYKPPSHVTLASSKSDLGAGIAAVNDGFAQRLPSGWTYTQASADVIGTAEARQMLLSELGEGGNLVSYHGHSGYTIWGSRGLGILLSTADVADLDNTEPNFLLQWGCWNTYFVDPKQETMGISLLFSPGGGAAGVIGAATLTDSKDLAELGNRFFEHLEDASTLGDALLEAQRDWAQQNADDVRGLHSLVLLGDPATPVWE